MRRTAPVLLVPLLLASCSGGTSKATPTPGVPTPSSTCPVDGPTIPANCVDNQQTTAPVVFPTDPSKIAPVTLPPPPGTLLGSADNRADPSRTTATFTVTVAKGARIGSGIACLGNGTVSINTKPVSKAFQSITCDADPQTPSELEAEDPKPLAVATTFTVTVKASAASRWDAAIYSTTAASG